MSSVDWSSLPPELIQKISIDLKIYADYIRFRAVCTTWRTSTPTTPTHLPCQLPWLMLPQSRSSSHRRAFFNLADNKCHVLGLPEASHRRRHSGSSHGWLVMLDEYPPIFLVNPLTRAKIDLPPLSTFPYVVGFDVFNVGREYVLQSSDDDSHVNYVSRFYTCGLKEMRDSFVKKIVLSNSPSGGSKFLALAIINKTGDLAYWKDGLNSWGLIEGARSFCEDVIYFNGLFYAADKNGSIAVCDVGGDSPRVEFIRTPGLSDGDMQYLVIANGELLLVTRYLELASDLGQLQIGIGTYETREFRVFKLDLSGSKWERVMSLGDTMLFLGENSSLALVASDFPECRGNRIYFTDDFSELDYSGFPGNHDLGIFDLEDGTIEQLPCHPRTSHSHLQWPPPIWITPNPC